MSQANLLVERVSGYDNMVRIPLSQDDNVAPALTDTLEACLRDGDIQIIVDLKNLPYPPSSVIAVLIEATARARRLAGDLVITNASRSAKNNLATFSALSYLNVDGDHTSAFGNQGSVGPDSRIAPPHEIPTQTLEFESANHHSQKEEDEPLSEDISDPPFVGKLEDSFEELISFEDGNSTEETNSKHLRVQSVAQNLYTICDFVTDHADRVGFNSKEIGKTKIAVYEACLNVIEHAYHSNPDNWIDVWVEYDNNKFTIIIQDYGLGFGEFSFKDYNVLSAMDSRKTGGFGLYIIRRSMDEVEYTCDEQEGNRLILTKYINHIIQ